MANNREDSSPSRDMWSNAVKIIQRESFNSQQLKYSWQEEKQKMMSRVEELKQSLQETKTKNNFLERKIRLREQKSGEPGKIPLPRAMAHIRTKSDIGTLQEANLESKLIYSHRGNGPKLNLFLGNKLTPDESKANSARNHILENYASSGSSFKVKALLNHRKITHKRKWTEASQTEDAQSISDRRIVHVRRDMRIPRKEDNNTNLLSSAGFNLSNLNSQPSTKQDLFSGALTQSATTLTTKKILAARQNLIYHLDVVRDIKFINEDELVSVSEVGWQ